MSGIGTLIESQNVALHAKSTNWGQTDASLSLYIISGSTFVFNKGAQFKLSTSTNGTTFSRVGGLSTPLPSGSLVVGKWQDLKFSAQGETGNATLSLSIDGVDVGSVPYGELAFKLTIVHSLNFLRVGDSALTGAFGFSADDGTAVIVKNVLVQGTDGNILYSNSLTSTSALQDFATGTNHYGACFGE